MMSVSKAHINNEKTLHYEVEKQFMSDRKIGASSPAWRWIGIAVNAIFSEFWSIYPYNYRILKNKMNYSII